jgi:hypothetical protein
LLANEGHRINLGTGIVVGAKEPDVLDLGRHRSRGRGMFLTGHLTLPISGGALIASCVIDVGVAAMQLTVAQYQDAANVLGDTIAGTSIQRIEPVPNHDCFHTRSPSNIADAGKIVTSSHNTESVPNGENTKLLTGCAGFERAMEVYNAVRLQRPGQLLLCQRLRPLRLLRYINRFDETDGNLIAVDPSKLATPVSFPHCRKHKEKLFRGGPSIEPPTVSLAPVSEISCIVHGRCHVPSIAIMFAENPRSNTTRCALRCSISSIHLKYKKNDEREQSVDDRGTRY